MEGPAYFKENKSAVIFIFDPAARGKIGIQAFIAAAEEYNYILVCSNKIILFLSCFLLILLVLIVFFEFFFPRFLTS